MSRRRTLACLGATWAVLAGLLAAAWNGWTPAGLLMLPAGVTLGWLHTRLDTMSKELP